MGSIGQESCWERCHQHWYHWRRARISLGVGCPWDMDPCALWGHKWLKSGSTWGTSQENTGLGLMLILPMRILVSVPPPAPERDGLGKADLCFLLLLPARSPSRGFLC